MSRIETEQLLLQLVELELDKRRKEDKFCGKFAGLTHYFGYEGRCSFPTNFDAAYGPESFLLFFYIGVLRAWLPEAEQTYPQSICSLCFATFYDKALQEKLLKW